MERMMDLDEIFREEAEKYKNSKSVEVYEEQLEGWFKIIDDLREENKKLKMSLEEKGENCYSLAKEKDELDKKVMKLQIEIGGLMGERDGLQMVVERLHKEIEEQEAEGGGLFDEIEYRKRECKKLKEKVETLELWLDNKEKLNEEYRKQIDLLKCQSYGPSELADSLYDADKTIEKLREEIKEIEKNQEYRYHRCMKAEKQVQHSLGGDDELIYEEGLYD